MAEIGIPFPLASEPAALKFMGEPSLRNVYPEKVARGSKRPVAFLPIPGALEFTVVADVKSRGMIGVEEIDKILSLHGNTLFEVEEDGDCEAVPGVIPGSKPVIMDRGSERFMSSAVEITIASPAVVSWNNHNLAEGTPITLSTDGELPTGLDDETTYYVLNPGTNDFQLSEEAFGTAINTSGEQSGTHTAERTEATYQVAITSNGKAFCYEDSHLYFVDIEEDALSVTYIDQRFVFAHPSGRFSWSDINDGRTVDPLSLASAEARPDGLVRGFADGGELYLFGGRTTEIYTGSDDPDAPFVKLSGTFMDKGCGSADTVVTLDNAPHWLGHDGIVYRAQGYQPIRISSHAVERAIEEVDDKTTIRGQVEIIKGHSFYRLTCNEWTWVYDSATGQWHERNSQFQPYWRPGFAVTMWNKRIVSDEGSGALLDLSDDEHTEDGRPIICELTLPDIPGRWFFHYIEFQVATGYGLNVASTEDGYEPQIMLEYSDDGGHNWSNERWEKLGKQGEFGRRVRFDGLGMCEGNGRRFRIACSEPTFRGFYVVDISADRWAA